MSLLEELEVESPPEQPKTRAKTTSPGNGHGESSYDLVNDLPIVPVLDWLGIEYRVDGGRTVAKCPKCQNGLDGTDVVVLGNALKCSHNTCAGDGPSSAPGLRSNIDLAMLVHGVEKLEAVKMLAERFNIELPRSHAAHNYGEGAKQPLWEGGGPKEDHADQQATAPVANSIDDAIELVRRRQDKEDKPVPVPFRDYAKAIDDGLLPGLEVVISLTGAQKTQFAVQKLLYAAEQGIPCLLVTLELTTVECALRMLAEIAGVSWSKATKGHLSPDEFERFKLAKQKLASLPIEIKHGVPFTFSSEALANEVMPFRAKNPTGPGQVVVDFAQLMKCDQQNAEARERVGRVLYGMQTLAKANGLVITAISSTARANNLALADVKKFADLKIENGKKLVGNPGALLSLGKESGEVELAADYQEVMARWPSKLENGNEIIIVAFAKYRLNRQRWFALESERGRLFEYVCEMGRPAGIAGSTQGGNQGRSRARRNGASNTRVRY